MPAIVNYKRAPGQYRVLHFAAPPAEDKPASPVHVRTGEARDFAAREVAASVRAHFALLGRTPSSVLEECLRDMERDYPTEEKT